MLNNSGESGHPCLVPDLRGTKVKIFPIENDGDLPGGPVVKTPHSSTSRGKSLIPGQGPEIPQAAWCSQKTK